MTDKEIERCITHILEALVDLCRRIEALERRYNDTAISSTMPTNDAE